MVLINNKKNKLISSKVFENSLEIKSDLFIQNNDKFSEISTSLAYYLKSFTNIKKLLDYICLIFKHIFNQKLILIIPLKDTGEIWYENIKITSYIEFLQLEKAINDFFNQFHFSKKLKKKGDS